ncbi:MAG: hypothetical protein ACPF82_06920, partial [Flavobacteriaceae bacterium]
MISLLVKLKILKPKNKQYGLVLLNLLFLTQEKINLKGTLGAHKKIKAMSEENVTQVNLIENGPVVVVGAVFKGGWYRSVGHYLSAIERHRVADGEQLDRAA